MPLKNRTNLYQILAVKYKTMYYIRMKKKTPSQYDIPDRQLPRYKVFRNCIFLDELPMIYTSCILAYCMYEVQSPPKRENVMLASALTILSVLFTMTHVYHKVPLIFFVSTYIFNYYTCFQLVEKFAPKNLVTRI